MAHVDDLTLLAAAQLLDSDNLYVGRIGDPDPDRRTRLDALASFMETALQGAVQSGSTGSYVRLANGLQVCWGSVTVAYNSAQSLRSTWTYPAAFNGAPIVLFGGMPSSGSAYVGLNLNSMGSPIFVTGPSSSSSTIYLWDNASPYSSGQSVTINVAAIGRWK